MSLNKFTERARGVVIAAQNHATANGNPRFVPEHILETLLDDEERFASRLLTSCGANVSALLALVKERVEALPKVSGSGSGQMILAPETAKVLEEAQKISDRAP